jgi:predicted phosphate transport protein (TIGR00153 family)
MGVQDLIRILVPKDESFFDFLEQQAALAHEGAVELAKLKSEPPKQVQETVHAVEKRGDKVAHDLEDALARTFVTPLDREDIHKLSVHLDDILDRAYAAASAFVMFGVEKPSEPSLAFLECLIRATKELKDVLPSLRKHDFDTIRQTARDVKSIEKEGDQIYRSAMTSLFSSKPDAQGPYRGADIDARALIREKEILEILEEAVDDCEDAAEFLANLAVKHA